MALEAMELSVISRHFRIAAALLLLVATVLVGPYSWPQDTIECDQNPDVAKDGTVAKSVGDDHCEDASGSQMVKDPPIPDSNNSSGSDRYLDLGELLEDFNAMEDAKEAYTLALGSDSEKVRSDAMAKLRSIHENAKKPTVLSYIWDRVKRFGTYAVEGTIYFVLALIILKVLKVLMSVLGSLRSLVARHWPITRRERIEVVGLDGTGTASDWTRSFEHSLQITKDRLEKFAAITPDTAEDSSIFPQMRSSALISQAADIAVAIVPVARTLLNNVTKVLSKPDYVVETSPLIVGEWCHVDVTLRHNGDIRKKWNVSIEAKDLSEKTKDLAYDLLLALAR